MRTGEVLAACLATAAAALPCPAQDAAGAPLPDDPEAERKLLEVAGAGFGIKRIEHFLIAYDTPDETVLSLRSRLEATYDSVYRFCKINDLPARGLDHRLEVLLFDNYEDYGQYAASAGFPHQGSAGFYNQRTNLAAFVNMVNLPEMGAINRKIGQCERRLEKIKAARPIERRKLKACREELLSLTRQRDRTVEKVNRLTVQHEVAHQVLFNAGVHVLGAQNPGWVVEGIATLFETPPSRSGAGVGATNQMRLGDFRSCLGGGDPRARLKAEDLQVALDARKFLPLRELIGEAMLFSRRNDPNLVHYYTQAWSLVFYLQRAKRQKLAEYLRVLGQRKPGETHTFQRELADFESVFGPPDERFERRWASFILDQRYKPSE